MDRKTLIDNLNHVFCDLHKEGKSYSKVWLEDIDFGGLYHSDKFVLNVKAQHRINDCGEEIDNIVFLLDKKAKEELKQIWRVSVHHADESVYCEQDLIVFEEEDACK